MLEYVVKSPRNNSQIRIHSSKPWSRLRFYCTSCMVFIMILPSWFLGSARPWLHGDLFVLEGHVAETVICGLKTKLEVIEAIS